MRLLWVRVQGRWQPVDPKVQPHDDSRARMAVSDDQLERGRLVGRWLRRAEDPLPSERLHLQHSQVCADRPQPSSPRRVDPDRRGEDAPTSPAQLHLIPNR